MKKIISIFLCFAVLMMVLCGCGLENKSETNSNTDNSLFVSDDSNSKNESKPNKSESLLTNTYKVPSKEMYIDYCYHKIEKGYTEVFLVDNVKFVAFTPLYEEKATDAKAAYNDTYNSFEYALEDLVFINNIDISEEKITKINGIDVYEFKGKMSYGRIDKMDGFVIGYSFVFDGFPCSIIGGVSDLEQPKAEIEEIKTVVEQMMHSVRSKF